MPGMIVATSWFARINRKAMSGIVNPSGHKRFRMVSVFDARLQVFRYKIAVAPVAFRPVAVFGQRPSQAAFIERYSGNYPYIVLAAEWKKFVFRVLVEDIVDDLDRINVAGPNRSARRSRVPSD